MKKISFFVIMCVLLVSCSDSPQKPVVDEIMRTIRAEHEYMEKYQMLSVQPETECVKIYFMKGESEFFDISVLSKKSRNVDISFYRTKDVTSQGCVKRGKLPLRTFMIFIPKSEVLKKWGYEGIDLVRSDGTIHHIDFELVDQP